MSTSSSPSTAAPQPDPNCRISAAGGSARSFGVLSDLRTPQDNAMAEHPSTHLSVLSCASSARTED